MTRKLIVKDGRGQRELLLVGNMVIGRDPTCDVSDANPLLSRRHAEFVVGPQGVSVRDLNSRNGILVNGTKVGDAVLRPGDTVQVGHLQLQFVEEAAPAADVAEPADAEATMAFRPPAHPAGRVATPATAPPVAATPAAPVQEDEKTRMVAAPRMKAPEPAAVVSSPASQNDDAEKTSFIKSPEFRPSVVKTEPRPAPSMASLPKAAAAPPRAQAPAQRSALPTPAKAERAPHVAKQPWTVFVLVQVTILAAIVFLSVEIPMSLWQSRVLNATAESRASALVNWLAADTAAALATGTSVSAAADAVTKEAGVVNALVLSTDGRVLAPASRSEETFATIPGVGAKADDVLRLRRGWNGALIEVARPVQVKDRRAAVAWVTFRPVAPPEAGNGAVVLAVPVIISLVATYLIATLISRRTMRALTTLNEDIELAVGGKLDAIGDPLGAKPVKDLSDAVNYLIARLRAATNDHLGRPDLGAGWARAAEAQQAAQVARASQPAAAPSAAGRDEPSAASQAAPVRVEARIVANSQFRVTEASPACADLLGARPDALIGEHLIDAIPDRQLGDAVMQCLGALKTDGEQRTSVALADRPYEIAVVVSRTGRDQPITVTFTAERVART